MRHGRGYRKLGRTSDHRIHLLRNLVESLIVSPSGRIRTTVQKAKEAKRQAERMITLGKRETLHARRQAAAYLRTKEAVSRLFAEVAPKFADRQGGYTRILRLGNRQGDNAEMALLELVGIAEEIQKTKAAASKAPAKAVPGDTKAKGEAAEAEGEKPSAKKAAEKKPKVKREGAKSRPAKPAAPAVKRTTRAQKRGE